MEGRQSDRFWKVLSVLVLLVLAKLALVGVPLRDYPTLVQPLQAQGVAIGGSAICTSAPDGRTIYCWSVVHGVDGPRVAWKGTYSVP